MFTVRQEVSLHNLVSFDRCEGCTRSGADRVRRVYGLFVEPFFAHVSERTLRSSDR